MIISNMADLLVKFLVPISVKTKWSVQVICESTNLVLDFKNLSLNPSWIVLPVQNILLLSHFCYIRLYKMSIIVEKFTITLSIYFTRHTKQHVPGTMLGQIDVMGNKMQFFPLIVHKPLFYKIFLYTYVMKYITQKHADIHSMAAYKITISRC